MSGSIEDAQGRAAAVLTSMEPTTAFDRVVLDVYVAASAAGVRYDDPAELDADVAAIDAEEAAVIVQLVEQWSPDMNSHLVELKAERDRTARPDLKRIFQQRVDARDRIVAIADTLRPRAAPRPATRPLPSRVPQPTFPEAKRVAQGLARPTEWTELPKEFALQQILESSAHQLRLEGDLMTEWCKPKDTASLKADLADGGSMISSLLYVAIGFVLASDLGFVDVDLDELISRVGLDPRSRAERDVMRLQIWRALNVIAATRVIGARRVRVKDRSTRKYVELESSDPLLTVSPFVRVGQQATFAIGVAPLAVTMSLTPWLHEWRGNRRVLTDFGNTLKVTAIPIGQPSGAWARAIGHALLQFWREQATKATFKRTGDEHEITARFRPFTRRELLEFLPPKPTLATVLASANPRRAVKYWDDAISALKTADVIAHYDGGSPAALPRQGWAETWATEPLDIRPPEPEMRDLKAISDSAKRLRPTKPVSESTT